MRTYNWSIGVVPWGVSGGHGGSALLWVPRWLTTHGSCKISAIRKKISAEKTDSFNTVVGCKAKIRQNFHIHNAIHTNWNPPKCIMKILQVWTCPVCERPSPIEIYYRINDRMKMDWNSLFCGKYLSNMLLHHLSTHPSLLSWKCHPPDEMGRVWMELVLPTWWAGQGVDVDSITGLIWWTGCGWSQYYLPDEMDSVWRS